MIKQSLINNTVQLSSFTIRVEDEEIEVPTYGVFEKDILDLLKLEINVPVTLNNQFIQRITNYRWIVYDPELDWISLRLLNDVRHITQ